MTATHSPFVELQFLINQSRVFKTTIQYLAAVIVGTSLALGVMSGFMSDHSSKGKVLASTTLHPDDKPITKPTFQASPIISTTTNQSNQDNQPQTQAEKWAQQAADANSNGEYDRLAKCETGGNWQFQNDRFEGGVGFMNTAWDEWKLDGMPDSAADATKTEQIVVAERIRNELPPKGSWAGGKWGCAGTAGLT